MQRRRRPQPLLQSRRSSSLGGSSVHYWRSDNQSHRNSYDQSGVHAGLGAEYLLTRAKRSLKPGDWAISALEPQLYYTDWPSKVTAEYVLRNDLGYLLQAPSLGATAQITFGLSPVDLFQSMLRRSIPWTSPIGRASTVSNWWDETLAVSSLSTPEMRAGLEKSFLLGPVAEAQVTLPILHLSDKVGPH